MPRQDPQCQDFAARLRPHGVSLLRYLRRLLHRPEEAADVLHSALARALADYHRFDPETCFRAWIYRFATHEARNANRRQQRQRRWFGGPAQALEQAPAAEHLTAELTYEQVLADPDQVLPHLDDALCRALRELRHGERAALLLRSQVDLSCAEVAAILQVPKGTVMSWLFRARAHLRWRLADYARERGLEVAP